LQNIILDLLSWSKLFKIQARKLTSIEARENLSDVALKMDQVANALLSGKDYFGNVMDPSEVGQALLRLWRTTHNQEWRFSTLNVLGDEANQIRLILSYLRDTAENLLREDYVKPEKPLVLEEIKQMMNPIGVCKYCRRVIEARAGFCPYCKKHVTENDIIEDVPTPEKKIGFIPKKKIGAVKAGIPCIFFLNEKTKRCECRKCGFAPYEEGETEDPYCRDLDKCPSCGAREEATTIKVHPVVKPKTILLDKSKKKAKVKKEKTLGILHMHREEISDIEDITEETPGIEEEEGEDEPVGVVVGREEKYYGLATGSPWPCEGKDGGRTGFTELIGPKKGRVKWSSKVDSNLFASPILGTDGNIYLGTVGAGFIQVKANGKTGWSFSMVESVVSAACMDAKGCIYFSISGKTFKLNPDGSPAWVVRDGSNLSPALDKAGNLYLVSGGTLVCIRGNREVKWRVSLGCDPDRRGLDLTPSLGPDGKIYVSTDHLLAFNNEGEKLFQAKLAGRSTRPMIDKKGRIYVGTENRVCCFDSRGKLKWQFELNDLVSTPLVLTKNGNIHFATSRKGTLYCISSSGERMWEFKGDYPLTGSASVDFEGNVYFANSDGKLLCVGPEGSKKWVFSSKYLGFIGGSMFNSSFAIGKNGVMYATCRDGKLYAFE